MTPNPPTLNQAPCEEHGGPLGVSRLRHRGESLPPVLGGAQTESRAHTAERVHGARLGEGEWERHGWVRDGARSVGRSSRTCWTMPSPPCTLPTGPAFPPPLATRHKAVLLMRGPERGVPFLHQDVRIRPRGEGFACGVAFRCRTAPSYLGGSNQRTKRADALLRRGPCDVATFPQDPICRLCLAKT